VKEIKKILITIPRKKIILAYLLSRKTDQEHKMRKVKERWMSNEDKADEERK
jgi:hypothetical protein